MQEGDGGVSTYHMHELLNDVFRVIECNDDVDNISNFKNDNTSKFYGYMENGNEVVPELEVSQVTCNCDFVCD